MNYPNGIKKQTNTSKLTTNINYKNRGMTLEAELNSSNEYYRKIDKAFIYKKPTPIKITKVDYPSRDKTIIKEAFFTIPSTTDYNGIYLGKNLFTSSPVYLNSFIGPPLLNNQHITIFGIPGSRKISRNKINAG